MRPSRAGREGCSKDRTLRAPVARQQRLVRGTAIALGVRCSASGRCAPWLRLARRSCLQLLGQGLLARVVPCDCVCGHAPWSHMRYPGSQKATPGSARA